MTMVILEGDDDDDDGDRGDVQAGLAGVMVVIMDGGDRG